MKERITVLMSVYNAEKFLNACIDSVLTQSYPYFLFYIIDDCSTDSSLSIINSYEDQRIRLFKNEVNIGLTKSLNKVIDKIQTKYVARIDADDLCVPNRFISQLELLEDVKKDISMVGSSAYRINENDEYIGEINVLNQNLKEELFFKNTFIHSSIMIRTEVLKEYKYDERIAFAQDYNLWVRIATNNNISNLKTKLVKYRVHPNSISIFKKKEQESSVLSTIIYQLNFLGIKNNKRVIKFANLHLKYFVLRNKTFKFKDRISFIFYLKNVLRLNNKSKVYNNYFNEKINQIINTEIRKMFSHFKKRVFEKIKL